MIQSPPHPHTPTLPAQSSRQRLSLPVFALDFVSLENIKAQYSSSHEYPRVILQHAVRQIKPPEVSHRGSLFCVPSHPKRWRRCVYHFFPIFEARNSGETSERNAHHCTSSSSPSSIGQYEHSRTFLTPLERPKWSTPSAYLLLVSAQPESWVCASI